MGIFDFVTDGLKAGDNLAERAAINAAFFGMAPDWLLTDIQNTMRSIGIPLPSAMSPAGISQLGATTLVIAGILAAVIALILRVSYYLFNKYMLFAISLAIIIIGVTLYKTNKKAPLKTLLKWVETGSLWVLIGVAIWIVVWLIGVKRVHWLKPDASDSPSELNLPLVTFILSIVALLSILILITVEALVPSIKSKYNLGSYVWPSIYILVGVPLILILINVWRLTTRAPGEEFRNPRDSLFRVLYSTFPLYQILGTVEIVKKIEDEKIKKRQVIGPKSLFMFRMGWTALFLFVAVLVTVKAMPELDSFIGKMTESFTNKIRESFTGKKDEDEEVEESFVDKTSVAEGPTNAEQVTLVNIQPVSIKQTGYAGPTEKGGSFETDVTIINAIREGVRFFVLQIDYLEKAPDGSGFDPVNVPTLLYRDDSGTLISKNGASIADIAKQMSTYAFNIDFPSNTQPLILYLHFVRTPNLITKPDKYMKFLMDVASALAPIQSLILNKHDSTDFTRQKNERVLLHSPLKNFEKKILLWTNADTTVFRNVEKLSIAPIALNQDLDYMACMRVYLDDSNDVIGVTTVAAETAHAVIVPFKRFKRMKDKRGVPNKEKQDFAMKGKSRFVIAMPGQTEEVKQTEIDKLLKTAGVNTVPMNLFGKSVPDVKAQLTLWGGNTFFRMKPVLIQSTKAAVAGYTPPPNVLK
jgi:hypothetical protein